MGNSRVAEDGEVFLFVFIYAPLVRARCGEEPRLYHMRSGGGEDAPCMVLLLSLSTDNCCFWRRGGLKDFAVSSYY